MFLVWSSTWSKSHSSWGGVIEDSTELNMQGVITHFWCFGWGGENTWGWVGFSLHVETWASSHHGSIMVIKLLMWNPVP